jgi:C4-dicarboxylate transporter/malic acid transport protein
MEQQSVVRAFGTNWFTVVMGVGIVAGLLYSSPIALPFAHPVGIALFGLLNAVFLTALVLWTGRWFLHTDEALADFRDPARALFYGALAMGINVAGNDYLVIGTHILPPHLAVVLSEGIWVAGAAVSLFTVIVVPYLLFVHHEVTRDQAHATWLIPVVPTIVAAATGLNLIPFWPLGARFDLVAVDLAMFGMTVFLFLMVSALYYARLVYHRRLDEGVVPSVWIEIGPIGMSMATFSTLPLIAPHVFPTLAPGLHAVGMLFAIAMWGVGIWWIVIAGLYSLLHITRHRGGIPYHLGWWSYVFPLGSFTNGTYAIAHLTHQPMFAFASLTQFLLLVGFFLVVSGRTAHGVWTGTLLPCRAKRVQETEIVQEPATA